MRYSQGCQGRRRTTKCHAGAPASACEALTGNAFSKILLQTQGELSERLIIDQHSTSHEVKEYIFSGPKSNFLKSREAATQELIDVTPNPTTVETLDDLM